MMARAMQADWTMAKKTAPVSRVVQDYNEKQMMLLAMAAKLESAIRGHRPAEGYEAWTHVGDLGRAIDRLEGVFAALGVEP